ncbi:MAG: hypothetical protein LKE52_03020 [Bacilli bacterium]|jgi:hypothetical protein|nr:hypothetical protein [Bacilli bacterium]
MNLKLNQDGLNTLTKLLEQKDSNMEAADLYNSFLTDHYADITKETIHEFLRNGVAKEEDAYFTSLLLSLDLKPTDLDIEALKASNGIDIIKKQNPSLLLDNPYYKTIRIPKASKGSFTLDTNYFDSYEGFSFDDVYVNPKNYFEEKTSLGYFAQPINYLTLSEKGEVWMSITPHEINTMEEPIRKAHGKVVTYGLGLGYFAFMASSLSPVESLTIVEKDKNLIKLFQDVLLPQFPGRDKIKIVEADAFSYMAHIAPKENFAFSFFDIYHTADDGLLSYLKAKNLESLSGKTEYSYWIERSLLALLRRYFLSLLEESELGYTEKDYLNPGTDEEKILLALFRATENTEITTSEELLSFLQDDSLKQIAAKAKI